MRSGRKAGGHWPVLYRGLIAPALAIGARLVAPFAPKVRRGIVGRRAQRDEIGRSSKSDCTAIHFHASSVGEFEQAKPIIEALRRESQSYHITASFFSSSGFDQQSSYNALDGAYYLPEDRSRCVREFLEHIDPHLIIIMRYDVWPEFISRARERGVPCVLVCATLRCDSSRFSVFARGFFGWLYGQLSLIDCAATDDAEAFTRLVPDVPRAVSGDTRYDRVVERAATVTASLSSSSPQGSGLSNILPPLTRDQLGSLPIVVAGSTWPEDEQLLLALGSRDDVRLVIVPHEPSDANVRQSRVRFASSVVLSEIEIGTMLPVHAPIIVDRTGVLLALYALCDVAFVGGGFGAGVHSVLEPAAYGVPVISGPRIERSRDAMEMRQNGLLEIVNDRGACARAIERLLSSRDQRKELGQRTARFVSERTGATARIIATLKQNSLLP